MWIGARERTNERQREEIYSNGLGVGRSGNMGDFNPFSMQCTEIHRDVSDTREESIVQKWGMKWEWVTNVSGYCLLQQ